MNITQQLTQMRAELEFTCVLFQRAAKRVAKVIKRAIRSCLWISSKIQLADVNEPTNAAPQGTRSTTLPDWPESPDANYQYRCDRMRENIDREVAEEQLFSEALEILIK